MNQLIFNSKNLRFWEISISDIRMNAVWMNFSGKLNPQRRRLGFNLLNILEIVAQTKAHQANQTNLGLFCRL